VVWWSRVLSPGEFARDPAAASQGAYVGSLGERDIAAPTGCCRDHVGAAPRRDSDVALECRCVGRGVEVQREPSHLARSVGKHDRGGCGRRIPHGLPLDVLLVAWPGGAGNRVHRTHAVVAAVDRGKRLHRRGRGLPKARESPVEPEIHDIGMGTGDIGHGTGDDVGGRHEPEAVSALRAGGVVASSTGRTSLGCASRRSRRISARRSAARGCQPEYGDGHGHERGASNLGQRKGGGRTGRLGATVVG
jgi:hypothetical protein